MKEPMSELHVAPCGCVVNVKGLRVGPDRYYVNATDCQFQKAEQRVLESQLATVNAELERLRSSLGLTEMVRLDTELKNTQAELRVARESVSALESVLEKDRTTVCDAVNGLIKVLRQREWLGESRGPYEWDDDRWHLEFNETAAEIREAIKPFQDIARDLANCPRTSESVMRARETAKEREAAVWNEAIEAALKAISRFVDEPRDNDDYQIVKRIAEHLTYKIHNLKRPVEESKPFYRGLCENGHEKGQRGCALCEDF